MSRFFAGGYSDSDSSSEEEDLLSSEEEELLSSDDEAVPAPSNDNDDDDDEDDFSTDSEFDNNSSSSDDEDGPAIGPAYFLKKSFVKGAKDDSDSEDEGKKVVKSAKDKLLDEIKSSIETIASAKKTNNWVNISNEFDKVGRSLNRASQQSISVPNFYIKALAQLDEFITETSASEKQSKKKMTALNSKAFNTVRQRVKKQVKELQDKVDLFKSDPELFEKEETVDQIVSKSASVSGTPAPEDADSAGFSTVGKAGRVIAPAEGVFTTLKQIAETRGKKNVDKFEQITTLEELVPTTSKPFELISVYLMLLSIRFDATINLAFMPIPQWSSAAADINALLDVLESNKDTYRVSENAEPTDDLTIEPTANAEGIKVLAGSISSLVERLDDELTRSLQNTDPHSIEYVDRLKDDTKLYNLIVRAQLYVELTIPESLRNTTKGEPLARIVLKRLDHIYYKPLQLNIVSEEQAWSKIDAKADSSIYSRITKEASGAQYANDLLDSLCKVLYSQDNSVYRKRAMLCHIYYYALNNQFYKSRDMFLMSHLQSTIHTSDPQLQVLFNRALVQLGLCAFRTGLIQESQQILSELATSQRLKELLGQGFQRYNQQISSIERQRLLPFHMHINLELLESVYMTSSLLIEIPLLASNALKLENRKKNSTRTFKKSLDFYDRQYFTGPPENIRDHILSAAKALQKGDWEKSFNLLSSIKSWKLFADTETLLEMLKGKLQVEGLRTYIFTYKSFYTKLSIENLAKTFQLSENKVKSVVSKMIFNEDISASINPKSNSVIFSRDTELSKLQELSYVLTDKISQLSEKNERLAFGGHQQQPSTNQSNQNSNQNKNYTKHSQSNSEKRPIRA